MIKPGDKYVIEIDKVIVVETYDNGVPKCLFKVKGFNTLVFDEYGLKYLEKYEGHTQGDCDWARAEGYEEGLKKGKAEGYEEGLRVGKYDGYEEGYRKAVKVMTTIMNDKIEQDFE